MEVVDLRAYTLIVTARVCSSGSHLFFFYNILYRIATIDLTLEQQQQQQRLYFQRPNYPDGKRCLLMFSALLGLERQVGGRHLLTVLRLSEMLTDLRRWHGLRRGLEIAISRRSCVVLAGQVLKALLDPGLKLRGRVTKGRLCG